MAYAGQRRDVDRLLRSASRGDAAAWGELLTEHEERLGRMIAFRIHPRLRNRIDPSDILQEAYLQAAAHREDYFRLSEVPLFLWLRGIVINKLLESHRYHLDARGRDAGREVGAYLSNSPDTTSVALVAHLTAGITG